MECSQSKLDDEGAVKLCKDRKRFIKQAVEQRTQFAAGHVAYIQSLKRVSAALLDYLEGDELRELPMDSFITPPFTPVKKTSHAFIPISSKSFTPTTIEFGPKTTLKVNYLRPSGNPAISVEERPLLPEMVRVETYSPMHQFGIEGFFPMQSSPVNPSIFAYSPNNRPNTRPPPPQSSQWDSQLFRKFLKLPSCFCHLALCHLKDCGTSFSKATKGSSLFMCMHPRQNQFM